jgi:hypothetical protein
MYKFGKGGAPKQPKRAQGVPKKRPVATLHIMHGGTHSYIILFGRTARLCLSHHHHLRRWGAHVAVKTGFHVNLLVPEWGLLGREEQATDMWHASWLAVSNMRSFTVTS